MIGFTTREEQSVVPKRMPHKSILELYPQYDFILAHTHFKKLKILIITYAVIPLFWGAFLVLVITNYYGSLNKLRSFKPRIIYIQNPNEKWWKPRAFLFLIDENYKWGLVDKNLKLHIEPQYDSMKWIKKNKLIEVKSGGKTMLIDINNNVCI